MRLLVASLLLAAGCPICPDGSIELVSGPRDGTVHAGDVIQLRARYGDDVISGPGACRGFWYVNQLEGGSAALGTIDRCGLYRAPAAPPPTPPSISRPPTGISAPAAPTAAPTPTAS